MYDNLLKILSRTLSRQSRLQLLMYYLIYNYRPLQVKISKNTHMTIQL